MKKSKKIGIFIDGEFIPSFSGASNRFHYLSRSLQEYTDTEVVIFLCDRGWSDVKLIQKEKFKTYLIHPLLFKDLDFLTSILVRENIDILQFANLELAIEVGIPMAHKLKKRLIFEAHYGDYEFAKSLGASPKTLSSILFLQNTFGRYFDKVIASSPEDLELGENLKIKSPRISVIHSGVDLDEFPNNCFDPSSKKIVFIGNLFFNVNLSALKEIKEVIYKDLRNLGYRFYIVGDISPENKHLLEDKDFIIMGKQENLARSFNKTLIALAPVLGGSGIRIKILTYLNAGIPVITTSQGARGFDKKALLIIEDDLEKYPSLITNLTKEKKKLASLSKQGRVFVQNEMSWGIVSKAISAEYNRLLKIPPISKSSAIPKISKLTFRDPAWIREVISKKRFKRNTPYVKSGTYSIINGKRTIVALEGLPRSGKSTFFRAFMKNEKMFLCIPETYIAAERNCSVFVIRKQYAHAELLKKEMAGQTKRNILLDRSFFSTLAFSYAKYKTTGDVSDYEFNKNFMIKNKDKILIPDYLFVFNISPKESLGRREVPRKDISALWESETFLRNVASFYRSDDLAVLIDKNKIIFIDAMYMTEKEIYEFISRKLKKLIAYIPNTW